MFKLTLQEIEQQEVDIEPMKQEIYEFKSIKIDYFFNSVADGFEKFFTH